MKQLVRHEKRFIAERENHIMWKWKEKRDQQERRGDIKEPIIGKLYRTSC